MSLSATSGRRFARRIWARRWSRLRVLVALGLVMVLAGVAGWVVLESSLLSVRTVEVSGTARVSPAEVLAAADVAPATPLARVDTDAVARRVRALVAVRGVSVSRRWPRSVHIVVQERVPAAVQRRGTSYLLVDRSGVAFDTVRKRPPGLPLVTAPVVAGELAFRAAVTVLTSVPASVRRQLIEVRAASPEQVTLQLTRDRTVVWGSPDRGERKAAVLTALMSRRAQVYDVSAPDAPTTRRT
jgi:cell division protein FtsQ